MRRPALMGLLLAGCLIAGLAGCASPRLPLPAQGLLHDEAFAPLPALPPAREALATTPAMRQFLHQQMAPWLARRDPRTGLLRALQTQGLLNLEYDAGPTRNAAEAFEARAGNCLSLVLMTAALAQELGLPVRYQQVLMDEPWSRRSGLLLASAHVNLSLGRRLLESPVGLDSARELVVDFLPPEDLRGQRSTPLEEATVLAMYLNNRAAEALAAGQLPLAYAWARAALLQDPGYLGAANTLAVVYLRRGLPAAADAVLAELLLREPRHTMALANRVQALHALGREAEAQRSAALLATLESGVPFMHLERGLEALRLGDAAAAREQFLLELARDPDEHESLYALAMAEARLGHPAAARRALLGAHEHAGQAQTRGLYADKLARLDAQLAAGRR